jgi:magnesium transporter
VDIEKPEDEDYAILDEVFGFHPLAIEDSINRSQRPKIESYNHVGDACQQGYFYMVIHGAEQPNRNEKIKTEELDMFVSERYLLTIHDEPMSSLHPLLQRAQSDPRLVLDPASTCCCTRCSTGSWTSISRSWSSSRTTSMSWKRRR